MRRFWYQLGWVTLLAVAFVACGKSGTAPPVIPEIRFEIRPHGGGSATFEIVEVQAADQRYTSLAGRPITIPGPFNVFVENAPPPFSITLRLIDSQPVDVTSFVAGVSNVVTVGAPGELVTIGTPSSSAQPAHPEVRADVCAPFTGQTMCDAFDGQSVFGAPISGSIGDVEATRLIGRPSASEPEVNTPSVYFYHRPEASISVIVRANDHRFLRLRLYINGALEDEDADVGDVVARSDL